MYRESYRIMENNIDQLRKRILPILLFCQANKGDLSLFRTWDEMEDAGKRCFFAYYSGLFCRILYKIEDSADIGGSFFSDCDRLLDKYNWDNIQNKDIELWVSAGAYGCEVPDALEFLDGIDDDVWKSSRYGNGRDALCLKTEHVSWTFADVRGSISIHNDSSL